MSNISLHVILQKSKLNVEEIKSSPSSVVIDLWPEIES